MINKQDNHPETSVSAGSLEGARRATGKDPAETPVTPNQIPNPEVEAKAVRRRFSAKYKCSVLEQADRCTNPGDIGALLRREGLYSSHLTNWRRQRVEGALGGLAPRKRGRKPDPATAERRVIATNRDELSDSQVVHWYNQRAEDSENRIKELKLDFGGDTLPCSDFNANALYFLISALSYNLFALMRQLLPEELAHHRAMTLRWRLYAIAAKVVRTGRQLFVKLKEKHRILLEQVLLALKEFEPPPI